MTNEGRDLLPSLRVGEPKITVKRTGCWRWYAKVSDGYGEVGYLHAWTEERAWRRAERMLSRHIARQERIARSARTQTYPRNAKPVSDNTPSPTAEPPQSAISQQTRRDC